MRDECKLAVPSDAGSGEPNPDYALGSAIRCRVSRLGRPRETNDGGEVMMTDVEIRVPSDTSVLNVYGVRVSKLRGATLSTPDDYRIVGEPWEVKTRRGASQIILNVERITGSSGFA